MKYYIDTEFIEGFHKPLFGKKRHHIDLISIGIVCEDGREYYAISKEYSYNDADQWVKDNVIIPMYIDTIHGDARNHIDAKHFHKQFGKPNDLIAEEIKNFICNPEGHTDTAAIHHVYEKKYKPEFYGYYADYDWVVFCSLFGRMIDLPKGFPMYCRDLKQIKDDYQYIKPVSNMKNVGQVSIIDEHPDYPKQTNEHNALADAKWNKKLHEFLMKL